MPVHSVRTVREAITLAPHRFLASSWPWRPLLYLLSGVVFGAVLYGAAALVVVALESQTAAQVAAQAASMLVIVVLGVVCAPWVARWGLTCLVLVDRDAEPPAEAPSASLRARLMAPRTWREVSYSALSLTVLFGLDMAVLLVALGAPVPSMLHFAQVEGYTVVERGATLLAWSTLWLFGLYLIAGWASARVEITRAVLFPQRERLYRQLRNVTHSRAALAQAFDEERRKIERDLHDGAQQRLVAAKTSLGLARLDLEPDSPVANAVLSAQEQVGAALADLRDLVRGIHPQVLTERGLPAAVNDVAARAPTTVEVDLRLPDRLPGTVESTAYFVVSEAITNASKHAPGAAVRVSGAVDQRTLWVEVIDDGPGGAAPTDGGGLQGFGHRLAVLDGTLTVESPAGGPTLVRLEVPLP